MAGKPSGWNLLRAKLAGEVPAAELEAYRRAGGPVFDLMDQVERRRLECGIDGLDPWTVPAATRAAFLCAWNAFVLQTLANDLVDADFALDPHTRGHLPPVTASQALQFYRAVDGWVSRSAQAQANPDYRLDVPVPAPLPPWQRVRPIPPAHLHGLVHAMGAVREHADAAMAFLPAASPDEPEKAAQLHRIRQLHASAQVHARYAEELGAAAPTDVHERGGDHARSAIEQFYLLGQLVADPALAKGLPTAEAPRPAPAHSPALAPAGGVPRLAGGWPVGARPIAPAPPPQVPASRLVTRHEAATGHTVTEPADCVDFNATLRHEARIEMRPVLVRNQWGLTVVMRVYVRGREGFLRIPGAALAIRVDGYESVLYAWPGAETRESRLAKRPLYEERVAYPFTHGLLANVCLARQLGMRFVSPYGEVVLDATTVARLQTCCRGFHRALKELSRNPAPLQQNR